MAALCNSLLISQGPAIRCASGGTSLKPSDQRIKPANSVIRFPDSTRTSNRKKASIQAAYRDDGGSSNAGFFVGGFILGGLIAGTLSCVYAPQISNVLTRADRKDLMKKLPKFIYDEDKALEKQRKKLADKIEQLNAAIDSMSTQLRSQDQPNGAAVGSDDIEALI
ncbi:uncharacterized protein LOC127242523 [Andrographis paniculata]|uniref:uncharacterized protein LOC127242523 n=1 Tax=Andrographis paniculata TaxID=175694 RepID=UPI0021E8E5EE|nr:uncharacterized protein LOC127242523 [Andrographis paniculata]